MNYLSAFQRFLIPICFSFFFLVGLSCDLLAQEKNHVVKSGETLSSIARKYNTTVAELQKLNPETKSGLRSGAELKIPGAEIKTTKAASNPSVGNSLGKVHEVKQGESLFKIAREYKVSVKDLEEWNQIKNSDLKAGQEIFVSKPNGNQEVAKQTKTEAKVDVQEVEKVVAQATSTKSHTVAKGQTLSVIARMYGSSVAEIKKLNALKSDNLNLGQTILVPSLAEAATPKIEPEKGMVAETPKPEVAEVKPKPQTPTQPVETQPEPKKAEIVAESPIADREDGKKSNGIREINNTLGYTRVVETGFAEAIEGDGSSKKHLCLHKTAAIGSILQVKNEMNGQSVFVKVIGKLPETGSNEKIIIRISRQAYDRLLAVGKRFPVEVSYPQAQP